MTRLNILVLPSWYPNEANPLIGSFFQEQAAFLSSEFNIRVLAGNFIRIGYRDAWARWRWLPFPGRGRISKVTESTEGQIPISTIFEYCGRRTSEQDALTAATNCYCQMIQTWLQEGWRPDLIHAQSVEDAGIVGASLSQRVGVPLIITEHNVMRLNSVTQFKRKAILDAFNKAAVVIAVSNHQLRSLYLQGVERRMLVVGNLIDEKMFSLQPKTANKKFRILSITYPAPIKDCETLFRAIAEVVRQGHADIQATIVGNISFGNLSEANVDEFQFLALKYGVEGCCRLLTHVLHSEMCTYFRDCDVYVSTSIAETFGIAVREAMACGRPVVATASGGVDDCLSSENGQKVDVGDFKAVAAAIIRVKNGSVTYNPIKIHESVIERNGRTAFLNHMRHAYQLACSNATMTESGEK